MARVPRAAERLIAAALRNAAERDMVLGDLEEELPHRGRAWYWRQALSIAWHASIRSSSIAPGTSQQGDSFMRTFVKDVRYAARSLFKRPLLTATVAATLALGLGANAAIFNLIDRVVLRPFPFADPDTVVMLSETGRGIEYRKESVSPANFLDWRTQADTLVDLTAMGWWNANLFDKGDPERVQGFHVSASYFDALGVRPALGRGFVRDDETFGRHHVVILGDELWKRRFGGDPSVVGRRVTIDGEPYEIIGVAPPRFAFPDGASLWAPLAFDAKAASRRDGNYLTVIGRLAPGHTFEEASSQMDLIAARLANDHPDTNRDRGVRVDTLTRGMMDDGLGPILSLWQSSALIVLLIACANIANLLLARAAERRREIAVRLALGATRGRVVRELLTESTLLALIAVPPALAFAWIALYFMRASMPARIIRFVPGFESLGPDLRLLAFTLGLALVTAAVFGILPALQAVRSRVADGLREGGRSSTGRQWLRRALVVAEMSIALPLLVAAGLGVMGTNRFLNGPQGYDPDGVLTMKVVLPERGYPDAAARRRFIERAMEGVAAIPGVERAAITNTLPAGGSNASRTLEIEGHPAADPNDPPWADYRTVTASYFETLRIPIEAGRGFTAADREGAALVAVISRTAASKYWPGEDPIGRRVRINKGEWMTVVGVCGDIIQDWFAARNAQTLYRPVAQAPTASFGIVVRTQGEPTTVAGAVRQALLHVDPTQPVFEMMSMRQLLSERTIGLQFLAAIMTVFAALALLLASVGLYAVIAYLVAQRRHEIGLRMALGASGRTIVGMTMAQALKLTLVGAGIGLVLSVALSRVMEAGLLGIASGDATIFAAFAAVLIGTALVAGYLPARRAAAVDPMTALRAE